MNRILRSLFLFTACILLNAGVNADPLWTRQAPEQVPAINWYDENLQTHMISDYRGHYIVLNFWATWCTPCLHEMPTLDALQRKYRSAKLKVIPVAMPDQNFADIAKVYRQLRIRHLPQAILSSLNLIAPMVDKQSLPSTFVIDPEGNVIGSLYTAADWYSEGVRARIENLLLELAAETLDDQAAHERRMILDVKP